MTVTMAKLFKEQNVDQNKNNKVLVLLIHKYETLKLNLNLNWVTIMLNQLFK